MKTTSQHTFAPEPLWIPQLQLDLLDSTSALEEALLYHRTDRFGFFSILQQTGSIERNGRTFPVRKQKTHHLSELPKVLGQLAGHQDVWIVQNEFNKPNRQTANLARICLCFVDLDYYKLKVIAWNRPEIVAAALLAYLDKNGIPRPSIIIDSGRGLQVKWILETLPAKALPRWNAVQKALTQSLVNFGADPQAKDASRVLRLVGTINSRSRTVVRVLYADTKHPYSFDQLADAVLPLTRDELRQKRAERAEAKILALEKKRESSVNDVVVPRSKALGGLRRLSSRQLWQDRLSDLLKLAKLRGWECGPPPGMQDIMLWIACCALTWARPSAWIAKELESFGQAFAPSWAPEERAAVLTTTLAKQLASERGEKIVVDGVEIDPRYRITNAKLIELLEITDEEGAQLKTIISKNEKLKRDAERKRLARQKSGADSREGYLNKVSEVAATRRLAALELRAKGASWAVIAETLGFKSASSARISCSKL